MDAFNALRGQLGMFWSIYGWKWRDMNDKDDDFNIEPPTAEELNRSWHRPNTAESSREAHEGRIALRI